MSRIASVLARRGEIRLVDFLGTAALGAMLGVVLTLGTLDAAGVL